jgi:hypothetical protein
MLYVYIYISGSCRDGYAAAAFLVSVCILQDVQRAAHIASATTSAADAGTSAGMLTYADACCRNLTNADSTYAATSAAATSAAAAASYAAVSALAAATTSL